MPTSLTPVSTQADSERARDYLFDMIQQLATLARGSGERAVAIHLEAILAAHAHEADEGTGADAVSSG